MKNHRFYRIYQRAGWGESIVARALSPRRRRLNDNAVIVSAAAQVQAGVTQNETRRDCSALAGSQHRLDISTDHAINGAGDWCEVAIPRHKILQNLPAHDKAS